MHYDDETPARPEDDAADDLVGPRRGGSRRRFDLGGDDAEEGGPRLPAAPRLRRGRGRRDSGPGLNRETVVRLVRDIPAFIKLLARLMRDPRVSMLDRAIVGGVLAYFVSPVDFIPDLVLPVVGHLDDIYLLALALSRLVNNAGTEVLLEHWDGEQSSLELLLTGLDRAGSILPGPARVLLGRR